MGGGAFVPLGVARGLGELEGRWPSGKRRMGNGGPKGKDERGNRPAGDWPVGPKEILEEISRGDAEVRERIRGLL
jgi:hypothetical protein